MSNTGLFLRAFGFAIAAMVLNVAAAFLWVAIYSMFVAPGHEEAYYQAYAQKASPISSIVAGAPIMFFAAWLNARKAPASRALLAGALVGIIYVAIDLAIMLSFPNQVSGEILALSALTKLAAATLGGFVAKWALAT